MIITIKCFAPNNILKKDVFYIFYKAVVPTGLVFGEFFLLKSGVLQVFRQLFCAFGEFPTLQNRVLQVFGQLFCAFGEFPTLQNRVLQVFGQLFCAKK
jgi:hypothetical protein